MKKIFLLICLLMACTLGEAQKTKQTRPAQKPRQQTQQRRRQPAKQQPPTVSSLKQERDKLVRQRQASVQRDKELAKGVKKGMEDLMALDTEIRHQRSVVDTIKNDIQTLDGYICVLDSQLTQLEKQLDERKLRYLKSMRYMHRNRSVQNQMTFVFSADNFNQMYRRLRFNREYAAFQKAQGEAVQSKQRQVIQKRYELAVSKQQKDTLLQRGEREQRKLEGQQNMQKEQVEKLKKEQKTVKALIEKQQKQEAELNARIDKLIAEEIAREKARLEAEAKKRAAEEAARKRKAEQARQKALEADRNKQGGTNEKSATGRSKSQETTQRRTQKGGKPAETADRRASDTRKPAQERLVMPAESRQLSGSFEANRGRLSLPITGAYRLIRGFGTYSPEGLSHVTLQSNGWMLKGQPGAKAQAVFNGVVSGVYYQGGSYIVTVRHGKYISVYINLSSVNVRNGQKVKTRDILGAVGSENTLQFQLRNWEHLLNPARWLSR